MFEIVFDGNNPLQIIELAWESEFHISRAWVLNGNWELRINNLEKTAYYYDSKGNQHTCWKFNSYRITRE